MTKRKRMTSYVIFASPRQVNAPNRYIADDGSVTDKLHAARFVTFGDAQDFAKTRNIELNAIRYIDTEELEI